MNSSEIREKFLQYFEAQKHKRVASSSLVPSNDPTLFFTNAGMVQFKDLFLGNEKRDYKRATSSQKCMRVSGKHNDLENVGRTPRHHTFFEMLGNFSFGDYFKKDSIAYGWEFLINKMGLPKENLYITIFEDDDEAEKLWKKHVDKDRIFRMGEKDNFWSMGDVGPCGPCSEIHFDREPTGNVTLEDFETDRFMEIWNLVFMQFDRGTDGKLEKLAKPSIDTGMGLERLATLLQRVHGNYETDLFAPVINQVEKICGIKYGSNYSIDAASDVSMRVIADHIRAMTFLIGDGVQPSNEGRGYVLRRIIRRAARHGKLLKIDKPFFVPLVHMIIDMMGPTYPEIVQHQKFIEQVISNEEERFNETLEKGLELLEKSFKALEKKGSNVLSGDQVFKLYDTFGFPKDLTEDIATEAGFAIDNKGFDECMSKQRERARSAWKGSGEESVSGVYKELNKKGVKTEFVGYDQLSVESQIVAMVKGGKEVDAVSSGDEFSFITSVTPFYGESGGQVGDTGMALATNVEIEIQNTLKPIEGLIVHYGILNKGSLKKGDTVTLAIDIDRRFHIKRNHTATHILHKALRQVLGEHVKQSGSMVDENRFRFDFSHFQAVTKDELRQIEADANAAIRKNLPVQTEVLKYQEAQAKGALAFFGDKYGDEVRVVTVNDYSCELCGGTHVAAIGEIGIVKIVNEYSVAAGIRRIEAVAGEGVEKYINESDSSQDAIASLLKVSKSEIADKVSKLLDENRRLQKELKSTREKMLTGGSSQAEDEIEAIGDIKLLAKNMKGVSPKELRSLADTFKSKIKSGVVMVVTEEDSKTSLVISVTKDLVAKLNAGNLMKEVVKSIGGTGGGRPDMAQGGAGTTGEYEKLKSVLMKAIEGK